MLPLECFEAIRLSYYQGLDQKTASKMMGVSRSTYGKILAEARRTVAEAIVAGKTLRIRGGAYLVRNLSGEIPGQKGDCAK